MKFSATFASAATLMATAQAADVTVSYMTIIDPGFTQTIPVGLDTSSTMTIDGWTVSGTATIVNDVAVIVDATAVYMDDLSGGGLVKGGNGPQNTQIAGDVTVVGGTIQGLSAATTTDDSSSSSTKKASKTSAASNKATATDASSSNASATSASSDDASATNSSPSTTLATTSSSSDTSSTSSSSAPSSTGDSGASRLGGGQALAMAGLGAAVVAAVI